MSSTTNISSGSGKRTGTGNSGDLPKLKPNPDWDELPLFDRKSWSRSGEGAESESGRASFIQTMMANRTFRSWWSFGWIRLHIVTFARTTLAEARILASIPGSDHHKRKFPKSDRLPWKKLTLRRLRRP
jgi:hypothetical protein